MKYPLVIFDFDGTLADSLPWFQTVCNDVAAAFGFRPIAPEEVDRLRASDARQVIAELGIPMWQVPLIAHRIRKMMTADIARIGLFAGVEAMLRELDAAGVTLVLCSSNSRANVERVLGPTLAGLFDHYACGAGVFGKDAKFRKVLKLTGFGVEQALAIGDELRDFEAARRVGMAFGAVTWGYTLAATMHAASPAWVFATPTDIATAVKGTAG